MRLKKNILFVALLTIMFLLTGVSAAPQAYPEKSHEEIFTKGMKMWNCMGGF